MVFALPAEDGSENLAMLCSWGPPAFRAVRNACRLAKPPSLPCSEVDTRVELGSMAMVHSMGESLPNAQALTLRPGSTITIPPPVEQLTVRLTLSEPFPHALAHCFPLTPEAGDAGVALP